MAMASSDVTDEKTSEQSDAHARLKRLYPSVKNMSTQLPSCWNQKDKHEFIGLSNNYLVVNYKGWKLKKLDLHYNIYNYKLYYNIFLSQSMATTLLHLGLNVLQK